MSGSYLLDTGPLVSAIATRDSNHQWSREIVEKLKPPLITCEAVITEACFLLHRTFGTSDPIFHLIDGGYLDVRFSLAEEQPRVRKLMLKYADTPMSLADACLVRMAEFHDNSRVLTLDSDFHVYRKHGDQMIDLITPGSVPSQY